MRSASNDNSNFIVTAIAGVPFAVRLATSALASSSIRYDSGWCMTCVRSRARCIRLPPRRSGRRSRFHPIVCMPCEIKRENRRRADRACLVSSGADVLTPRHSAVRAHTIINNQNRTARVWNRFGGLVRQSTRANTRTQRASRTIRSLRALSPFHAASRRRYVAR